MALLVLALMCVVAGIAYFTGFAKDTQETMVREAKIRLEREKAAEEKADAKPIECFTNHLRIRK